MQVRKAVGLVDLHRLNSCILWNLLKTLHQQFFTECLPRPKPNGWLTTVARIYIDSFMR